MALPENRKFRVKGYAVLGVFLTVWFCRDLPAQEPKPEASPRYRLIQVVGASTLQEKINEAAGGEYRLLCVTPAPGESLAAIMEKAASSSDNYKYVLADVQPHAGVGNILAKEANKALDDVGAKGFHLHTIIAPGAYKIRIGRGFPHILLVMEKALGSPNPYQYQIVGQKKVPLLAAQGYHVSKSTWLLGRVVILEKSTATMAVLSTETTGASGQSPDERYRFLEGPRDSLPQRKIDEGAVKGYRVIDVSPPDENGICTIIMEKAATPPGIYDYRMLKPARKTGLGEEDLNQAGAEGFRLLMHNATLVPFVMEKAPGSSERFQYRLLASALLSDLAEKLEEASRQGYQVVVMSGLEDGIAVVMERSQAVDSK
jgi:hypothetical protein